jgi:hypothetical protein
MNKQTSFALKSVLSLLVVAAAQLIISFDARAQTTYQKRLAVHHVGAFTPTSLVYSGMYNGNAIVVTSSDVITFNPSTAAVVGKSTFSVAGHYFHVASVYQQGRILYCAATDADSVQEVGCLLKYDLATNAILWQKKFYLPGKVGVFKAITGDNDTGIFVAGTVYDTATGKNDILLIKASTAGNIIWTRKAGIDTLDEVPSSICFNSESEIYVSGTSYLMADGHTVILRYDNLGNLLNAKATSNSGTGSRPSTVFSGMANGKLYTVDKTYIGPSDAGPAIIRVFDSSFNLLSSLAKSGLSPENIFVDDTHLLVSGPAPITSGRPGFRTMRFDTGLNLLGARYFDKIPTSSIVASATCFIDSANQSFHFFKDGGNDTFYVVKADSTEYVGCLDTVFTPGTPVVSSTVAPYPVVSDTFSVMPIGMAISQYDATITTLNVCPFPEMIPPINLEVSISLFPNPCQDAFTITTSWLDFTNAVVTVRLSSADGKIVQTNSGRFDSVGKLKVTTNGLPPGLYFCEVANERGLARAKVVVW